MAQRNVAVVAHSGKRLGGGLTELRRVLGRVGYPRPIWYGVPKSSKAPKAVRRAVKQGARLIFVWGGDGMVQRCIDALAGKKKVELAISTGDKDAARQALIEAQPEIHRGVTRGVIHRNTAARKLSRLSARVKAL